MTNWTSIRQSLLGDSSRSFLPKRIKLPIMPLSVMKFAQRAEDPKANPEEFARIIETDSSLTGNLLQYVNSSATGLSQRVRCIQQAIAILGIQPCKLYLLSTAIKRSMKGVESRLIDIETFWAANLEKALFAREIAVLLDADHDLAFAGGMLQDFLLPITTNEMHQEYREFLGGQTEKPQKLAEFEREQFHWDHAEVAAHVMFSWDFPDSLICCVLLHHRGLKILRDERFQKTAAAAVALSALIPDSMMQELNGLHQLLKLDSAWPQLDLMSIAKRVDERFTEISPVEVNRTSLLSRCQRATVTA